MNIFFGLVCSEKKMRSVFSVFLLILIFQPGVTLKAQTAEEIIMQVRAKIEKVNDYMAQAKLKTNVAFIKAPIANVKIYFKKPNKIRMHNVSGISFIPKGSVNISLDNVFTDITSYDIIDVGREKNSGLRIIKLLPRNDTSQIVLSTLYIDDKKMLIKKSTTTTRDNGTYELQMSYGKYADYGLADKIVFSFNTKDYKLPKGITFDYDDGTKTNEKNKIKDKKGKVEIDYSSYIINQGVPDSVFQ
ncbi:MAG: LolA family protein [Ginsengibacter sp.]